MIPSEEVLSEVMEVQLLPSLEVRISPPVPAVTNLPFAYVIPNIVCDVPEGMEDHVLPSEEVMIDPD